MEESNTAGRDRRVCMQRSRRGLAVPMSRALRRGARGFAKRGRGRLRRRLRRRACRRACRAVGARAA
eukprot:227968-Pleurochrysis_carterae.AAC.1